MADAMSQQATPVQDEDPEATAEGERAFEGLLAGPEKRQILSKEELLARITSLLRSCEGCENVTAIEMWRLDRDDRKDGCNWSLALMLDAPGVEPEVYTLAYGSILHLARKSWNLE